MLKYLTYFSLLVAIISGAVCYLSTSEESFFYYLITSIVSGAISCVLLAIKMITADTRLTIRSTLVTSPVRAEVDYK